MVFYVLYDTLYNAQLMSHYLMLPAVDALPITEIFDFRIQASTRSRWKFDIF